MEFLTYLRLREMDLSLIWHGLFSNCLNLRAIGSFFFNNFQLMSSYCYLAIDEQFLLSYIKVNLDVDNKV